MTHAHLRAACGAALLAAALVAPMPAQDAEPAATAKADASDWPQWRGPNRNGVSPETQLNLGGKKELWTTNVGLGYSTVSVQNGRAFTIGHSTEDQKDTVFCIDTKDGSELWTFEYDQKTMKMAHQGGSLTTPTADGDRVYVQTRQGTIYCLDAKTGKKKWSHDLRKKYSLKLPTWGFSAAPLLLDKKIYLNVGHLFCFDRKGKLIWKTERKDRHCYATPADFKYGKRDVLAVFNGHGLCIVDRKNGKEIADYKWKTKYDVNAATPVVIGSKIFISSGYNHGCAMLELKDDKLELLWESKVMRNHMSGCTYHDGHLYGYDESSFKCIDLEGNEVWKQRLGKAAHVVADGKLVLLSGRGHVVIAKLTSEGFKEISRDKVLSGGVYWTTPVIADGKLYVRNNQGDLACLDVSSKGTK